MESPEGIKWDVVAMAGGFYHWEWEKNVKKRELNDG